MVLGVILTNALLWILLAGQSTNEKFDSITVREFHLVDAQNKERATIEVEPSGEVVFRLRDECGIIRVKMGASAEGSGFVFLDEDTNPVIHGLAKKDGGKLTLTDAKGNKREY